MHRQFPRKRGTPCPDPSSSPAPAPRWVGCSGSLKGFSAADLGGIAIKGALEQGRRARRPGRLRDHGPGPPGRRRPDHRPPGRGQARHPDGRARADHQQGVPVGHRRDRPGRPADPRRRVRRRRRRRHGVDDQRPAPAAEQPRGLQVRRLDDASTTWPTTACSDAFDRAGDGRCRPSSPTRATTSPARSRTSSPPARTSSPRAPPKDGLFDDEIVPVTIPQRKGDPIEFSADEGVRADTTVESLSRLRPAFTKDGTITAGSASQISDGAAAVVVMSKAKAEELGPDLAGRDRRPRRGRRPRRLAAGAAGQRRSLKALREGGHRARPTSTWSRSTRRSPPSGIVVDRRSSASTRRRSTSTAARSPSATRSACPAPASCCTWRSSCKRRGGGVGAAALCGGGGQGDALIVRVPTA